jgi:hypothetical protein
MTVQAGTIVGITHLLKSYSGITGVDSGASNATVEIDNFLVAVNFPAYVASTDTYSIAGVGAAITSWAKDGKTYTLRNAQVAGFGKNSAGTAVTCTAVAVSVDALTGNLTDIASTEIDVPLGTTTPITFIVAATTPA